MSHRAGRPSAATLARRHIVHAGDIGGARILDALAAIAPLAAVRGNNDHGLWAETLNETARL